MCADVTSSCIIHIKTFDINDVSHNRVDAETHPHLTMVVARQAGPDVSTAARMVLLDEETEWKRPLATADYCCLYFSMPKAKYAALPLALVLVWCIVDRR